MNEVVRLEEHVAEFGVAEAVFRFEAALDGIFGQHDVNLKHLSDVAKELEIGEAFEPVVVVDEQGAVIVVFKVDETRQLRLDAVDVVLDLVESEEISFRTPSARVADHAGGAADESDWFVSCALESSQIHDRDEMADVE